MYRLISYKIYVKVCVKSFSVKSERYFRLSQQNAGFTLLEILVVILIVGILSAIAAPSWIGFVNRQQVNKANDAVLSAIQEAQREAKRQKLSYSVSFKTQSNVPQFAIYPTNTTLINWKNLAGDLNISSEKIVMGTNITDENTSSASVTYASSQPQTISFDYLGALNFIVKTNSDDLTDLQKTTKIGDKGLIVAIAVPQTTAPTQPTGVKRCIIVKTLLGSIKSAKDTDCN